MGEDLALLFEKQLERLDELFPGTEVLNNLQTCRALGISDKTLKKHYGDRRNNKVGGYSKIFVAKTLVNGR